MFRDITTKPKIEILLKIVSLIARTKPHIHYKIHDTLINMTFTMACPNFWKAQKMDSSFLRINIIAWKIIFIIQLGICHPCCRIRHSRRSVDIHDVQGTCH
jgi:hypothetical protein